MASAETYLSKHLHARGLVKGVPVSGTFELTPRCNFQCKMCYVHLSEEEKRTQGKELTKEEWIQIGKEAKEAGVVFLLLTGGEPFLRPDFMEIYQALKKMGFLISINTNGSLIRGKILEQLCNDPPARINITLYGGCNDTYEKLCGTPMFEQVLENIEQLQKAGVSVRLNVSLTPYNCTDVESIFKIARERNLHVRYSAYMNPPVRVDKNAVGTKNHRFNPEDAAKFTVEMEKIYLSKEEFCKKAEGIMHGVKKENKCQATVGSKMLCRAGRTAFWITWDGRMLPCGMFSNRGTYVKDVGLQGAWEKTKQDAEVIRMPAECLNCSKKEICSVCAAMCQSETGDFHKKPEYICCMTEALLDNYETTYKKIKGETTNEN